MKEFRINDAITEEITMLKESAHALNENGVTIPSNGVDTLKTAMAYIAQQEAISNLLNQYRLLLLRDAKDLGDMVAESKKMDVSLASSLNT